MLGDSGIALDRGRMNCFTMQVFNLLAGYSAYVLQYPLTREDDEAFAIYR